MNRGGEFEKELLGLVDCYFFDFERYRGAGYELDGDNTYVIVHTRCGGGNREGYEAFWDTIALNPCYDHDEDCTDDNTYADIYFRVPEDRLEQMKQLIENHFSEEKDEN